MNIGERIKYYRLRKNLTQKDLAGYLHVTFQAISRWERDETEPSLDDILKMTKIFGITVDELLGINKDEK